MEGIVNTIAIGVLVSVTVSVAVYFLVYLGNGTGPWFSAISMAVCLLLFMLKAPRHNVLLGLKEMRRTDIFGAVACGVIMFAVAAILESPLTGLARGLVVTVFIATARYLPRRQTNLPTTGSGS